MALSKTLLEQGLAAIANSASADAAAQAWASAYDTYARAAQDVSNDVLVSANPTAFYAVLAQLFEATAGASAITPLQAAQAFGNAFAAYWAGASFAIAIPPAPGTAGTVGGDGVFLQETTSIVSIVNTTPLIAALDNYFASPDTVSVGNIADTLHAATTSLVVVLITGLDTTPTTPLPITNTNTIY